MFKLGDIVQVKSGGPAMTVIAEGESVECLWFADGAEAFRRETFPAMVLETIEFEDEGESKADEDDDNED
jgi:uncharacterized protein YodC (DUF2158 family)